MPHWERRPDTRIARFVERIAFSSDEGEPGPHAFRVVPDGCIDLLFSVPADAASRGAARADVFGTKTRPLLVESGPPVENVAVRFRPGAAVRFLRTRASALTDAAVDLAAFWGEGGRALVRAVARTGSADARAAVIERALLERLDDAADADALDRVVQAAVSIIAKGGGRVPVREIAARLQVGERRLERAFSDRVGVGPKRLSRILRFRRASAALARGARQADVAFDAGYSDQAHLLRDFRELAGAPPPRLPGALSDSSNRPG